MDICYIYISAVYLCYAGFQRMTHEAFFHNEFKLADLMYMFMKVL